MNPGPRTADPPEGKPPDRNTIIRDRILGGATLAEVARDYSLTRQRVSQIMAGCPGWDGEKRRATRAAAKAATAAAARASRRLKPSQRAGGRTRTWTDTMILNALRDAATATGNAPSAIQWRYTGKHPSVTVIITRFGSWNAACSTAGLHVHRAPFDRDTLTDDQLISYVAAYLAAEPFNPRDRGGIRGYTQWARDNHAPGPGALRTRFGSWSRVKASAVEQLTNRDRVSQSSSSPHE